MGRKKKLRAKTRRFEIWLDKGVVGCPTETDIVEVPGDLTEEETEQWLQEAVDVMISNAIDTGWCEIDESDAEE